MAGKAGQPECEAAGYTVSVVRKQGHECNALLDSCLSPFCSIWDQVHGSALPTFGVDLPFQLNLSEIALTAMPRAVSPR